MAAVATFGEILLRLSPPGKERLFQTPEFRASFGGAEANVAVSLAALGHEARFISVIPGNEIGSAALRELQKNGVDVSFVVRKGRRLGIYFVEPGANQRPAEVVYDRAHSAIAEAKPGDIDWKAAFSGVSWFHLSGITPAISRSAASLALAAVKTARARGIHVSIDLNYRSKLWTYGVPAPEIMSPIFAYADTGIANEEDLQKALGLGGDLSRAVGTFDHEAYARLTAGVLERFPRLERLAVTLRESRTADDNVWSAVLRKRDKFLIGPSYEIGAVVDRIGSGDAFAAGLIHGLMMAWSDSHALAFAVAASCWKHSVPGDFNLASEAEITLLMKGDRSGRVRR